jgi:hypothetical protein
VRLAIVIGAAAAAFCLAVESAQACSCVRPDVPVLLAQADAAFVGTLVSRRPVSPPGPGPTLSTDPDIFTFRVDESVKGGLSGEVEVRSARSGASCGLEVGVGQQAGLFLRRDGNTWHSNLCWQVAPSALLDAGRPLPAPNGRGPVRLLVGGEFTGARLLALDGRGRTLGYGGGAGSTRLLSVCPRGDRVVEVVSDRAERVEVRNLRTLAIIRKAALPAGSWAAAVHCRDRYARDVYVLTRSGAILGVHAGNVREIYAGKVREIYAGRAPASAFGGRYAYLSEGEGGQDLIRLDLASGAHRLVTRAPTRIGYLALSAAGDRIAGVLSGSPRPEAPVPPAPRLAIVRLDRTKPLLRSTPLGSPYFSGELRWLDRTRLAVFDYPRVTPGGIVRVFDHSLRQVGPAQSWEGTSAVVASGLVYGLALSQRRVGTLVLEAARLPAHGRMQLRELPAAPAALAVVPGRISLRRETRLFCLPLEGVFRQ